jgi:hypothetical protein
MVSLPVLAAVAAPVWAVLAWALLRAARPVTLAFAGVVLGAGVVAAAWKYPSWEAVLLLLGAPVIALAVTRGQPARMLDPRWTSAEDTEEAAGEAERYAFRAVLAMVVSAALLVIAFGL